MKAKLIATATTAFALFLTVYCPALARSYARAKTYPCGTPAMEIMMELTFTIPIGVLASFLGWLLVRRDPVMARLTRGASLLSLGVWLATLSFLLR